MDISTSFFPQAPRFFKIQNVMWRVTQLSSRLTTPYITYVVTLIFPLKFQFGTLCIEWKILNVSLLPGNPASWEIQFCQVEFEKEEKRADLIQKEKKEKKLDWEDQLSVI